MGAQLNEPIAARHTEPVQSVDRAMQVLEAFARRGGLTLRETADATGLPRGTVYRLLQTLVHGGYLRREADNNRYWVAPRALLLSAGFREEDWVTQIAQPILNALAHDVQWPMRLMTLEGGMMRTRAVTDPQSPFAEPRVSAGASTDILRATPGWTMLAFSSPRRREVLLASVGVTEDQVVDGMVLRVRLAQIREEGFAFIGAPTFPYAAVSTPVLANGECIGIINMGYYRRALKMPELRSHYIPLLQLASQDIGQAYSEQRPATIS